MFENILGRDELVSQLRGEIMGRTLPPAILLHGPQFEGKLSVALEVARALTCLNGTAKWDCACESCSQQRSLLHPHTVMVGGRYFSLEIRAARDALLRKPSKGTQFLFLRAIRKLTRRYDSFLWEGDEGKLKRAAGHIDRLSDLLAAIEPPADPAQLEAKTVESAAEASEALAAAVSPDGVGVQTVRRLSSMLTMSADSRAKIVIIERADAMGESARNALLKTLEEPPADSYLLLLAENRAAILPTILSRVREVEFRPRPADVHEEVCRRIFHDSTTGTLRRYFLAYDDQDYEAQGRLAADVVAAMAQGGKFVEKVLAGSSRVSREALRLFAEELTHEAAAALKAGELDVVAAGRIRGAVHGALHRSERLNLSADLAYLDLIVALEGHAG